MLAKEQYIGTAILLAMVIATWLFVALWPQPPLPQLPTPEQRDSLRQDSLARVRAQRDSLRTARWEHKKDSFRRVDQARFDQWSRERQQRYDSFRLADSLWRDSVGMRYAPKEKKDTILDLNRTDTAQL